MKNSPPLSVIKAPSGRYIFVGRVPGVLAFTSLDGGPPDPAEVAKAASFGERFGKVKPRGFDSYAEAAAAAVAAGFSVRAE
jgi:hypothetical protein